MSTGRTFPSYRIESEMERWKWKPFRHALDKKDRKVFDCRYFLVHDKKIVNRLNSFDYDDLEIIDLANADDRLYLEKELIYKF
jgi:hypothetical protein